MTSPRSHRRSAECSDASAAVEAAAPLRPIGLTQSSMFLPAATLTAVAAVLAAALPDPNAAVSFAIVAAAVILVGIPHGAVDHLVAAGPMNDESEAVKRRFDRRFHVQYIAAILVVATVWFAAPAAALIIFLIVSAHHFGQSDLAWCGLPKKRQLPLQWSRGLLLVGFPLIAHLDTIAPIIDRLGGGRPDRWNWLNDNSTGWCVGLLVQHAVVGVMTCRHADLDATWVRRELTGVSALVALFAFADPLIGFAVYFGLWHSLGHVLVLRQTLTSRDSEPPLLVQWRRFARLALPRTLLASGGIVVVIAALYLSGRSHDAAPMLFVLVSAVTIPHLVVVERLWQSVNVHC